jgi:hypothetical protein
MPIRGLRQSSMIECFPNIHKALVPRPSTKHILKMLIENVVKLGIVKNKEGRFEIPESYLTLNRVTRGKIAENVVFEQRLEV